MWLRKFGWVFGILLWVVLAIVGAEGQTAAPSSSPTDSPSESPTISPSVSPTSGPSESPSASPTLSPSEAPSVSPTSGPSESPSVSPTLSPSASPTVSPTAAPSESPTMAPTAAPTFPDRKLLVSSGTLGIVEDRSRSYVLTMDFQPSTAPFCVDVQILNDATGQVSVNPTQACFDDYGDQVAIQVSVARDYIDHGTNPLVTLNHTELDALEQVGVTIYDVDIASIILNQGSGTVYVGGANTSYGISLASIPSDDVVVTLSTSGAARVGFQPSTLTFTSANWNNVQTVDVYGLSDSSVAYDAKVITHSLASNDGQYNGIGAPSFLVQWYGQLESHVVLSKGTMDLIEGIPNEFFVKLNAEPSNAGVQVTITSDITGLVLSPTSLDLRKSNFADEHVITVNYPKDSVYSGTLSGSITVAIDGGSDPEFTTFWPNTDGTISMNIYDADRPEIVLSTTVGYVTENGQGTTYSIALTSRPQNTVTITIANPSPDLVSVTPSTISISPGNWDEQVQVTIQAIVSGNDGEPDLANSLVILSHSVASGDPLYDNAIFTPQSTFIVRRYYQRNEEPCPNGSYFKGLECVSCPAGYMCVSTEQTPIPCTLGTFSLTGQSNCTSCPAGMECTQEHIIGQCEEGTYSELGDHTCHTCPIGKACPDTELAIVMDCGAGTYSFGGQTNCTSCKPGFQCPHVSGAGIAPCDPGTYAEEEFTECIVCPAGYACVENDRAPTAADACVLGTYTEAEGGATFCISCPPGYACPYTDSRVLIPCSDGEFSLAGNGTCTRCPAGYSCSTTSGILSACSAGQYSPLGHSSCISCPGGFACPSPERDPQECPAGMYSVSNGKTACTICPAGYFCPKNITVAAEICPEGHYSYQGAVECTPCDPGYWCSEGAVTPTPPGDICAIGGYCNPPNVPYSLCPAGYYGTLSGGISAEHACDPCPAGMYCHEGTTPDTRGVCPPGHYCPLGTTYSTQFPCPAGTYNPNSGSVSSAACSPTPEGSYSPRGSPTHYFCPSGYFCPEQTGDYRLHPCPSGTYSGVVTGLVDASECKQCEPGAYCPVASVNPILCDEGTYNPEPGMGLITNCLNCVAGWSCPRKGMTSYLNYTCSPGHYCPTGTVYSTQFPCPPGRYTDEYHTVRYEDCPYCPKGKACHSGTGGVSGLQPYECAPGHYCPLGTQYSTQFDCPPGTWTEFTNLEHSDNCTICESGYYCVGGQSQISGPCATGHYCPPGTHRPDQFPCPIRYFTQDTNLSHVEECDLCIKGHYCEEGTTDPEPCPPGTYSDVEGESNPLCKTCPAGYRCPTDGTVDPLPCDPGYYSPSGSDRCYSCEKGYHCHNNATSETTMYSQGCQAGLYCNYGVNIPPSFLSHPCPDASYCPFATPDPVPCPVGTYNPHIGGDALDDCLACDEGYYCTGASNAVTGICDSAHYCPPGSSGPQQFPCPAKTYRNIPGGIAVQSCTVCPGGSYCPLASVNPIPCPKGSYCPIGADLPEPCPLGRYGNASMLTRPEECFPCPAGHYCDGLNLTEPRGLCDPGYFCKTGSYSKAPGSAGSNWTHSIRDEVEMALLFDDIGGICPPGGYCPIGSSLPLFCEPGTFNNISGAMTEDACIDCLPGFYCSGYGNGKPSGPCEPGHYCPGGDSSPTSHKTPPGFFSLEGAYQPEPCEHGTFNNAWGQDECLDCLPGFFCANSSTVTPESCPPGAFCPNKTTTPILCPLGTYSNSTQLSDVSQCIPCAPGHYCEGLGLVEPSGKCTAGHYCTSEATVRAPRNLPFGDICWSGHYCPEGTSTPHPCPLGTYNPRFQATSIDDCIPCEPGQYCGERGLTGPNGPCEAGFYCNASSFSARQNICPIGFSCPTNGTSVPTKCGEAEFNDEEGRITCKICPQGYHCDGISSHMKIRCPRGSYCPSATGAIPPKCPPGTYGAQDGLVDVADCTICPSGYFCDAYGLTNVSGTCVDGYICDPGSKTEFGGGVECIDDDLLPNDCPAGHFCQYGKAFECPMGTFNPFLGATKLEDCRPCDSGFYCNSTAIANQTDYPCPTGHYCEMETLLPVPCPSGTYRDFPGAGSAQECFTCPPGYFCPGDDLNNATSPFYWKNETIRGSTFGLLCPSGTYCIGGNVEPEPCPLGYKAQVNVANKSSMAIACEICPPGTHGGDPDRLTCDVCGGGYICLEGAKKANPTSIDVDRGYVCPAGYFCEPGALKEVPCDPGTYNNLTARAFNDSCVPCTSNTFNEVPAQVGCKPCPSSSIAKGGAIKCECLGRNRAFEVSSGKCLCVPGFEAYDQSSGYSVRLDDDEDGTEDCQPITYTRCGVGEILTADGSCLADCSQQCPGGKGKLSLTLGVCDCDDVPLLDELCDEECRTNSTNSKTDGKSITLAGNPDSGDDDEVLQLKDIPGFHGKVSCGPRDNCKVVPCGLSGAGTKCFYDIHDSGIIDDEIQGLRRRRRRRLQDGSGSNISSGVPNPVICINVGDTVFFNISDGNVPVYQKDSLLNTNPSFDYGPFRYLQRAEHVKVFGFTFTEPGLHVFASSQNKLQEIIISVQAYGSACPKDGLIVPKTTSSLLALGAQKSNELILAPDWSLIGALLGGMVGLLLLIMTVLFVFREFALGTVAINPKYRKSNDFTSCPNKIIGATKAVVTPFIANNKKKLAVDRWGQEDLDAREVVERIVTNHQEVDKKLSDQDRKLNELFTELHRERDELKDLLKNIRVTSPVPFGDQSLPFGDQDLPFNMDDDNDDDGDDDNDLDDMMDDEEEELQNDAFDIQEEEAWADAADRQDEHLEMLEMQLLSREDITEEERERLMEEFKSDQQVLRESLDLEKRRQQEDLKNRLAERKLKNRKTIRRRNEKRLTEWKLKLIEEEEKAENDAMETNLELEKLKEEATSFEKAVGESTEGLDEAELAPIAAQIRGLRSTMEDEHMLRIEQDKASLVDRLKQEKVSASTDASELMDKFKSNEFGKVMLEALDEIAEEQIIEKAQIETELLSEVANLEKQARLDLEKEIEETKVAHKDNKDEATEIVAKIRAEHEAKLAKMNEDLNEKRKEKYKKLHARIAAKRKAKVEEIVKQSNEESETPVNEEIIDEVVEFVEHANAENEAQIDVEISKRKKEDLERRLDLERREKAIREREAQLLVEAAALKKGLDAEEEIKKLKESHQNGISLLEQEQDKKRSKQREALKRKAEERRKKQLELKKKQEEKAKEEEFEETVDKVANKLKRSGSRRSQASMMTNKTRRTGEDDEEYQKRMEELKKKRDEEMKKLEEEMELARKKMLAQKEKEEEMERKRMEDERRKKEDELKNSAKTEQEIQEIKEAHEKELAAKMEKTKELRQKQREKMMKRLEAKKQRKQALLDKKQDLEARKASISGGGTPVPGASGDPGTIGGANLEYQQTEQAAIHHLLSKRGLSPNEIYRAVEKILEPRHSKERNALSEKHYSERMEEIRKKFESINEQKRKEQLELVQNGAAVAELEALEEKYKGLMKVSQCSDELREKQRDSERQLVSDHASQISKYVNQYVAAHGTHNVERSIRSNEDGDLRMLQQIITQQFFERVEAISRERRFEEQIAKEKFERKVAQLEKNVGMSSDLHKVAEEKFESQQKLLLQEQATMQRELGGPNPSQDMVKEFALDRERLVSALKSDRSRQLKALEERLAHMKTKSIRFYESQLSNRLVQLADLEREKKRILKDSIQKMFDERNFKVDSVIQGTLLPPSTENGNQASEGANLGANSKELNARLENIENLLKAIQTLPKAAPVSSSSISSSSNVDGEKDVIQPVAMSRAQIYEAFANGSSKVDALVKDLKLDVPAFDFFLQDKKPNSLTVDTANNNEEGLAKQQVENFQQRLKEQTQGIDELIDSTKKQIADLDKSIETLDSEEAQAKIVERTGLQKTLEKLESKRLAKFEAAEKFELQSPTVQQTISEKFLEK